MIIQLSENRDTHVDLSEKLTLSLQQNVSRGNILQRSISAQAQADAEALDLWRSQGQISIAEIRAEAQKHLEVLQEIKQAQETPSST
jgi:hypothetical protein